MYPFRISALEEREAFYTKQFDIRKLEEWFEKHDNRPQRFAIDPGTETKIIKDRSKLNEIINFNANISYAELKEKLVENAPEDAYYDRNQYKDPQKAMELIRKKKYFQNPNFLGQELAFDMDSDNLECAKCKKKKFTDFCPDCFRRLTEKVPEAHDIIRQDFRKIEVIYSGRGYHFHVFDKKAYALSLEEREAYNQKLKQYFIDPWVSRGRIRLIRLPYSLNALVSRIAIPLKLEEINALDVSSDTRVVPEFLKR